MGNPAPWCYANNGGAGKVPFVAWLSNHPAHKRTANASQYSSAPITAPTSVPL